MNKNRMNPWWCGMLMFSCSWGFACKTYELPPSPADQFKKYCSNCHGLNGNLSINGAIKLQYSLLNLEERKLIIANGRNAMTGFSKILSPLEIQQLAEYTLELKSKTDQ